MQTIDIFMNFRKIKSALIFVCFWPLSVTCMAQKIDHVQEVQQILELIQKGNESDEIIVQRVEQRLDFLRGMTDKESLYEKSILVELAAFTRHAIDPPVDRIALESKRRMVLEPYTKNPFRPDMDGKELLYYSAGVLGIPVDQKGLMDYARNGSNPLSFRLRALKAIAGQAHLLPQLETDLVELTKDDINFPADSNVGPRTDKKFYPIREEAAKVLKKLKEPQHGNRNEPSSKLEPVEPEKSDQAIANAATNHTTKPSTHPKSNVGSVFILGWIALFTVVAILLWVILKSRRSRGGFQ